MMALTTITPLQWMSSPLDDVDDYLWTTGRPDERAEFHIKKVEAARARRKKPLGGLLLMLTQP